jgi:hypothetical protein
MGIEQRKAEIEEQLSGIKLVRVAGSPSQGKN